MKKRLSSMICCLAGLVFCLPTQAGDGEGLVVHATQTLGLGDYPWNGDRAIIGMGITYPVQSGIINASNCEIERLDGDIYDTFFDAVLPAEITFHTFEPLATSVGPDLEMRHAFTFKATSYWPAGFIDLRGTGVATDGTTVELQSAGTYVQVRKPGDATGDYEVDFSDFLVLSRNWGLEGVGYEGGDFDLDGFVTFDDFLILSLNGSFI
ncbi:hypothetical protein OAH18_03115 [bacterium]|nr:hypothetical protein [bacterium]